MKTFLNVLYRRILYKIPLKLLLFLVAVFGLLFACFSSAVDLPTAQWREEGNIYYNGLFDYVRDTIQFTDVTQVNIANDIDFVCFKQDNNSYAQYNLEYSIDGGTWYDVFGNEIGCTQQKTIYFRGGRVIFFYFMQGDGFIPEQYSSLQCQTEYNLIPVSSVDSAYCEDNNLCSSSDCPGSDLTPGVSNIFINDLFHPGAFNVIMNIPQEIDWDYAYTNSGQNLNIDVVGYNVDYEKMQTVIDNQNYKPSSEDLNTIVSTVVPLFIPGLVILLFLYFVFRFIKKIF